jgi:hypothetical protein
MKRYLIYISMLALTALLFVSSCSKDHPDPVADATKRLTDGTWTLVSVTGGGGTDQTALFQGMTLQFTETTYTTTHGGVVWPASDTWTFEQGVPTAIRRGDGVLMNINAFQETQFVLSFSWDKTILSGGRTNGLIGQYNFTFTHTH